MESTRFWAGHRPSLSTNDNNSDYTNRQASASVSVSTPSLPITSTEEIATENTPLIPASVIENMNSSNTEEGSEVEEISNGTTGHVPEAEDGDRAALLQQTNNASDTNANITPATGNTDAIRVEDSIIIDLTNRLRYLFACLTVPIFPLGILLFILLARVLYCAFVKDIAHTCSHPLKLYAILSFTLSSYFPQHKRVKTFLFGYNRERDGPVRPRSVRIYDQLFHLLVLNYVYFGMILVQSCKDDTPTSDDGLTGEDLQLVSTCEATCPFLYGATCSYVLILQVLVIVFLLPLVCLPFIYLWIVRRVTTEEAWARFGRVAAGEDAEDESGGVTAKEILEQMNEVVLVQISGEEGLIKVVQRISGNNNDQGEGRTVNNGEHQVLEWTLVKDCCICQDEFDVSDDTALAQEPRNGIDAAPDLAYPWSFPANSAPPPSMLQTPQADPQKDMIVQTKCGHLFHKECIEPWICGPWGEDESSRTLNRRAARKCCPLCRRDLAPSVSTPSTSNLSTSTLRQPTVTLEELNNP